jgi:hypothetical protein
MKRGEQIFSDLLSETHQGLIVHKATGSVNKAYRKPKKVRCLRCRQPFTSAGPHNRLCAACAAMNKKEPLRHQPTYIMRVEKNSKGELSV